MNATAPGGPDGAAGPAAPGRRSSVHDLRGLAHHLTPAAIVLLGLALAWTTQLSPWARGSGRLVALPVGLVVAALVFRALLRSGWWRSRTVWAWLSFWIVWAASLPWTLRPAPMPTPDPVGAAHEAEQVRLGFKYPIEVPALSGREEVTQLALAAAVTGAMLLLAGGSRRGVLAFRACWLAVVWTTAPVAIREIITDEHIITTRWGVWSFAPHIPAGPFQNPNNYAAVLACAVGVLLVWALERPPKALRLLIVTSAAVAAGIAYTTGSRAAVAAIMAQALVALIVLVRRRKRATAAPRAMGPGGRTGAGPGRLVALAGGAVAGGAVAGGAVALLVAASLLVPALRERNPVIRLITAGDSEIASSDSLRIALSRAGLRYWWEHPWLGTGAGTFETRLATELPRDVSNQAINVHNAFVEILSQYGIVVFTPFAVLLCLLAWRAFRPPRPVLPGDDPTTRPPLHAGGMAGSVADRVPRPDRRPGPPFGSRGLDASAAPPSSSGDAASPGDAESSKSPPDRDVRQHQVDTPTPDRGAAHSYGARTPHATGAYRLELSALLLVIVTTALGVSSALALPMWFVMIAHATQVGRVLERR